MKMKKIMAGVLAVAAMASTIGVSHAAETNFTDVRADAWYASAVSMAASHDLMTGIGSNMFAPNLSMNRAMAVQVLYNQAGKPNVKNEAVFTDVKKGDWYYNAVQWAAENEITAGVGNNKFAPNVNVTRQEFAQFLYGKEGKPEVEGSLNFIDANNAADWAKNALLWANQNGIINGAKSGNQILLNPTGNATRAEAASMLVNFLDISESGHTYEENTTKEATCTEDGEKTLTCSICGKTKTEAVPATGHIWEEKASEVWVVDQEAYDEDYIDYRGVTIPAYFTCRGCNGVFYYNPEKMSWYNEAGEYVTNHHDADGNRCYAGEYGAYTESEERYKIHHDEVGHYEEVTFAVCSVCGEKQDQSDTLNNNS